jgi:transposase
MTQWSRAPQDREQMVLFAERLDEVIPADHTVRLLDAILVQLDWAKWEVWYHGRLGQPPIHPRVLTGVLLYGLLTRIRSSRALEEALVVRLDFRWLVEGRTIDHTTLSEFRRRHGDALKDLFVQVGLVARQLGFVNLERLAFDGTRVRSNNRRSGSRTPEELRRMKDELAARYTELEAKLAAEDARDDETFGSGPSPTLPAELADVQCRQRQVAAALAELERAEQAGETLPKRLPLTDPQSRITPNKDGGFAPNYTPLAMVDVASGLVVSADVIAMTDEDHYLLPALDDVQQQFGPGTPTPDVLSDGLNGTGANLAALEARGITLYSPSSLHIDPATNPAIRDDPQQAVPPEQWDRLPMKTVKRQGKSLTQLDKAAFIYDAGEDCYWCPLGKRLSYANTTSEPNGSGRRVRRRYQAAAVDCSGCPLRDRCLQGRSERRSVNHEQHEAARLRQARHMATPEAKAVYALRRHPGERPFAMIKQHFGARRFLLRGLAKVRVEWNWLTTAFNLHRLLSLIRSRAGPTGKPIVIPLLR